jgi:hypothetical protein
MDGSRSSAELEDQSAAESDHAKTVQVSGTIGPIRRGSSGKATHGLNPLALAPPSDPGALISVNSAAFSAHGCKNDKYLTCTVGVGTSIGYMGFVATEMGYLISPLDAWRKALGSSKTRATTQFLSCLKTATTLLNMNVIEEARSLVRGCVPDELGYDGSGDRYISLDDLVDGERYRVLRRFMRLLGKAVDDNNDFIHERMRSSLTPYVWVAHALMGIYVSDKAFFEQYISVDHTWLKRVVERSFISEAMEQYMMNATRYTPTTI